MPKNAPEVVACGAVDELTSVLGVVRVNGVSEEIEAQIDMIQGHLVALMGLLSVPMAKREKYLGDGYPSVSQEDIDWLEELAAAMPHKFEGWARPGASGSVAAAWMDMARTICRRAELAAWGLGEGVSTEACRFLNRLSDVLWLWARKLEKEV